MNIELNNDDYIIELKQQINELEKEINQLEKEINEYRNGLKEIRNIAKNILKYDENDANIFLDINEIISATNCLI